MTKTISIEGRSIGRSHRPFIIAEMSGNHNQSLDRALAIVDAAAKSGAHALKLQTYTADTMTLNLSRDEFFIDDPGSLWSGRSLHALYQEAHTPWEWHGPIFERARSLGMIPFSTPFDSTAVDFLEQLGVSCYKIASFENTDLPLIRKVAATGKPMIISTGMATVAEIDEAVRCAREAGCKELVLLKCTSTYPAAAADTNLLTIPHMRALFGCEVGLSDHTFGIGAGVASVALGATVIEKHFTLSRAEGGVDFDVLDGAGRDGSAGRRDRARLDGAWRSFLWPDRKRTEVDDFPPLVVRGGGSPGWRRVDGRQFEDHPSRPRPAA